MATSTNALWQTFLQGRTMPLTQDEWRAAADELGAHVRPILDFLRAQEEGKRQGRHREERSDVAIQSHRRRPSSLDRRVAPAGAPRDDGEQPSRPSSGRAPSSVAFGDTFSQREKGMLSNARPQIGEAAVAGDDGVELGELRIPPMIAAIRDQLARRVELLARFLQEPRGLGGVGRSGRRRARVDEAVQRREGLDARKSEARSLERAIAKKEPHRPQLGDLLDLVEVARCAIPVADGAAEGGAGQHAAHNPNAFAGGAQVFDRLIKRRASGACGFNCGLTGGRVPVIWRRQCEKGTTEAQFSQPKLKQTAVPARIRQVSRRPITHLGGFLLGQ